MNKNTRKILALSVMTMFVFMFAVPFVVAEKSFTISIDKDGNPKIGGVHEPIENPEWLFSTVQFFGLGQTWADFIIALAIILIIFGATFDILNLTAFSTGWVKYMISAGIAVAFAVTGAIGTFAVGVVKLMGGSIMVATTITILVGAVLLVMGTFMKGKLMKVKAKSDADKILAAGALTTAKSQADIAEAKARAKEVSKT